MGDADGRDQTMFGGNARLAGVHEHETSGAVGVLGATGLKTAMAEQRRLLVTRHARDRWPVGHNLVRYAPVTI